MNPEHLSLFRQGTRVWNQWRQDHAEIQPDLSDADLRPPRSPLEHWEMNLSGVDFSQANLSMVCFHLSDFSSANLTQANLEMAMLGGHLDWTNLQGANLAGANLRRAYLNHVFLNGA